MSIGRGKGSARGCGSAAGLELSLVLVRSLGARRRGSGSVLSSDAEQRLRDPSPPACAQSSGCTLTLTPIFPAGLPAGARALPVLGIPEGSWDAPRPQRTSRAPLPGAGVPSLAPPRPRPSSAPGPAPSTAPSSVSPPPLSCSPHAAAREPGAHAGERSNAGHPRLPSLLPSIIHPSPWRPIFSSRFISVKQG